MFSSESSASFPGVVTSHPLGRTPLRFTQAKVRPSLMLESLVTWHARAHLPGALPRNRSFTLSQRTTSGGERFYRLPDGCTPTQFINAAFVYGHAIRARDVAWDFSTWVDYLIAKHAYDWLIQSHAWVKKRFRKSQDFSLRKSLQPHAKQKDLLPEYFGCDFSGGVPRWTIADLEHRGRAAAKAAGVNAPRSQDVVAYGFFEAAKLWPVRLSADRCAETVRDLLIDDSRVASPSDAQITSVVRWHLEELIRQRLDLPQQRYAGWLSGGHSNIIQCLQRSAKKTHDLSRDQIHRALLDLAWQGLPKIAECLEAFMGTFAESLPEPLSPYERRCFEAVYYRQDYLAGITLMQLAGRSWVLRPAIEQLWVGEDRASSIGTLHRVMFDMTEAARESRVVERARKAPRLVDGGSELENVEQKRSYESFEELMRAFLETERVRCPHCQVRPSAQLIATEKLSRKHITLQPICAEHGACGDRLVTNVEQLQLVAMNAGISWDEKDPFHKSGRQSGVDMMKCLFRAPSEFEHDNKTIRTR